MSKYSRSPDRSRSRSRSYSRERRPVVRQSVYNDRDTGHDVTRYRGRRPASKPNNVLGVFGMDIETTEDKFREVFQEFGKVTKALLIYEKHSNLSKGYGFVYFETTDQAVEAKKALDGDKIDGATVRVDFSLTKKAHSPTPGRYYGRARTPSTGYGGFNVEKKPIDKERLGRLDYNDRYKPRSRSRRSRSRSYDKPRYRSRSRSYDKPRYRSRSRSYERRRKSRSRSFEYKRRSRSRSFEHKRRSRMRSYDNSPPPRRSRSRSRSNRRRPSGDKRRSPRRVRRDSTSPRSRPRRSHERR